MGKFIQEFGEGGGRPPDFCNFLQGGGSGNPIVGLVDLGDDLHDRNDPRRITPQGGPPSGRNEDKAGHVRATGIPAPGCINDKNGDIGGVEICPPPQEHHLSIYHDSSDTGAMYINGMAAGITGVTVVVGAGQDRPRPRGGEDRIEGDGSGEGGRSGDVGGGEEGGKWSKG